MYGNMMSYQKKAAPFQAMVKRADGSAFSNPTINGLQSFKNPMVPVANSFTGFDPMSIFWWLKNSQQSTGTPYKPNMFSRG